MPKYRVSKRFSPSSIIEMLVPFFLVVLLLTLLVVFIIIGLSLFGVTPSA
ncbi:hypothetical protein [Candidatus Villigracilis saccharophilus]|jgi:hypothetical protein|nr:hypothetical protein [Anaerolineales bacterium]